MSGLVRLVRRPAKRMAKRRPAKRMAAAPAKRMAAALSVLALSTFTLVACGSGVQAAHPAAEPKGTKGTTDAARTAPFAEVELAVLSRAGVTDGRLARRFGAAGVLPTPKDVDLATMSVIRGDSTQATVIDGTLDPFSFDARKKVLGSARDLAATLPDTQDTALEKIALSRLLAEELARVDEERALPESASALVFAMTAALADTGDLAKRDTWLAGRLDEIAAACREHPLSQPLRAELDDALDPLEKKAGAYPATVAALSRLRDQLEDAHGASPPPQRSDVGAAAAMYLTHVDQRPTTLPRLNQDAEELVLAMSNVIHVRQQKLPDATIRRMEARAGKLLLSTEPCTLAAESGRVRGMPVSREREAACRLVLLVNGTDPNDEESVTVAWLVARDVAAMSRWAVAPEGKRPSHPFMSTVEMADARKLERAVLSRPAAAIGAMKAAQLLFAGDSFQKAQARARAWQKLGDLPLDVVATRLPQE
jgi:hypothetical protein